MKLGRAPSADDGWRKKPGRKNRARWCGGHEGREHQPTIVLDKTLAGFTSCRPLSRTGQKSHVWTCIHVTVCGVCGRTLRGLGEGTECPERPEGLRVAWLGESLCQ